MPTGTLKACWNSAPDVLPLTARPAFVAYVGIDEDLGAVAELMREDRPARRRDVRSFRSLSVRQSPPTRIARRTGWPAPAGRRRTWPRARCRRGVAAEERELEVAPRRVREADADVGVAVEPEQRVHAVADAALVERLVEAMRELHLPRPVGRDVRASAGRGGCRRGGWGSMGV